MKIMISRVNENIMTYKNYEVRDRGEVAHVLAELDVIRRELLCIWDDMQKEESQ